MAEVDLQHVSKTYDGNIPAVVDVSLTVADQEFLVLVGPSGCGKSTLLRMIAGLEEVTDGTICIGERPVNNVPPKDRDVAMVFQNYALYPHMTVQQNLAFGLKLRKLPKTQIAERIQQTAALLGIEELLQRKPRELSGGQRQRVAVGRAIVRKPAVFLFDEPLSNLDARRRTEMRRELADLHRRLEATIVYVTHDQVEAMTLGDRIVVMNEGQVQQIGPPLELYDHPTNRFVAGFLGTPSMNFWEGELRVTAESVSFHSGDITLPLPRNTQGQWAALDKQSVTLGLRPEHLSIVNHDINTATFPATVEDIQPLGGESLIYLKTGKQEFILRDQTHQSPQRNQQVTLKPNLTQAHLFTPQGTILPTTP
ncbi:sn-glycerol-3-phosphate import ATP-binding protein UgpC [Symmachiella dynata]|uniref:ABC transporter ATP-binding protein n=1 Tax=Symmachiella dynata TaxID=2527995 RepID=UPI00118A780D|nr:sn-glycerol-3-phosphate ABC transporter ATP-binding protein UgpC [Symmachiella dynata]QDT49759.1 sn-glycerol-3-phosphate import ATP-binding protein UgpC [Symmachiella dynata]